MSAIAVRDLVPVDLVYSDRVGEIYHGAYNPDHRWYYFPEMAADEAVLIKGYDSEEHGRALRPAHRLRRPDDDHPAREHRSARALVLRFIEVCFGLLAGDLRPRGPAGALDLT